MWNAHFVAPLAVLVIFCGCTLSAIILILAFRAGHHKREMLSRERLAAIEKGMEITLLEPSRPRQANPLAGVFVLIAVGIGISLFLWQVGGGEAWGVGLIPGTVGLGLLAHWLAGGKRDWERQRALDEELRRAYIDRLRGGAPAAEPDPIVRAD
ncbi:MAG TPA: DUF6249 domain-containing protein [Thermoanaerobaculia bacterium]|nr:DUF6249 domain-containing protein [Thermoanaerobaculia bacterium]